MNKTPKALTNNKQRGFLSFPIMLGLLAVVYIFTLLFSLNGWGYMGYNGYRSGPSFWYWGGPNVYYDRSVRNGSYGSTGHRGGGISGGK